ncbi:MAG: 5'-methylthioadenosine/adenosylhomocysteine nucleosidase [bacterium]
MTGLIGAMAEEIELFRMNLEAAGSQTYARMEYLTGQIKGQEVVLLKSGIGKVNATIGTQVMIDRFDIEQIIFTGLAGALVPNLNRGDMVVANHVVQYDFDLTAFGRRHGELPDVGRLIEADPRLVKLVCYGFDDIFKLKRGAPRLQVGTIASGDRFVSDPRKIEWLQREFGAVATEMEGAAVGYTCLVNEVPFVVLRTISDTAGTTAPEEFDKYLTQASHNSFRVVSTILEVMSHRAAVETAGNN